MSTARQLVFFLVKDKLTFLSYFCNFFLHQFSKCGCAALWHHDGPWNHLTIISEQRKRINSRATNPDLNTSLRLFCSPFIFFVLCFPVTAVASASLLRATQPARGEDREGQGYAGVRSGSGGRRRGNQVIKGHPSASVLEDV